MRRVDEDPRTTEELGEAAAGGDRAALEALLVRHLPDLRAYVRLRMGPGVRARENESDVLQSVCREVLLGADRFRHAGEGAFKSWLYATTLRKLVDRKAFHRAEKRDVGRLEPADVGALTDAYRRFSSPSQKALAADEIARLEAAFATLSDEYREVILLTRVVGLSRAEAAAEMGKTEDSVRNLLHRALARLADAVATDAG